MSGGEVEGEADGGGDERAAGRGPARGPARAASGRPGPLRFAAPATTANLGPGFDTLGLALGLANEAAIEPAPAWSIEVEGEGAGRLAAGEENLVLRAVRAVEAALGRAAPPQRVRCQNRIPLGRGLGSSAAAAALGGVIAYAALGDPPDAAALLAALLPLEGHPDNLAACLYGGFTAAAVDGRDRPLARRLPLGWEGPLAVVVPAFEVPTREARAALPATYPRADVVWNLQRTALVIAAFASGERALLAEALADRLHEPYRRHLYPGIAAVERAAAAHGAIGLAVSGAGPTLLAIPGTPDPADAARLAHALASAWRAAGTEARGLALPIARAGAGLSAPASPAPRG